MVRQTTLISVSLGLFLVGLITVRFVNWTELVLLILSLAIGLKLFLQNYRHSFLVIIAILACFVIGVIRGEVYVHEVQQFQQLYKKQVSLLVTAREDAVYSDRKQLIFSTDNVQTNDGKRLVGNIEVEGFGVPMVYKGDRLLVKGKLFPKRGDNIAGVSFAEISIVSYGGNKLDQLRRSFATGLQNTLPEPLASLGLGILIGQRSGIPNDLTEQLRRVGLIHIVAVSGYNLTILIYFAQRLLRRRSRFQATVLPAILIVVFLLITGFSPSIVRAGVVSGISLLLWYYGRQIKPLLIILLSASITAGWNPLYIWSSIGWYLSFLAFFGILILSPLIVKNFVPLRLQKRVLPQLLSETFSAQICTIPILLYIFRSISVISLLANLLVVPLIPFVMLATAVTGLYGMVGPFMLGGILVLPARIMLGYIVEITESLSKIPFAIIEIRASALQTALLCLLIIILTLLLYKASIKKLTIKHNGHIV